MAGERLHLVGDYELDRARGCLLRRGAPVHLRPQSYRVLEYLAENRGRLIAKDQLIQRVWEGRAVGDDSLVQCLRDVRQALEDHAGQHIRTVRGRGYIFDPEAPTGGDVRVTERTDVFQLVVEEHDSEDAAAREVAATATFDRTGHQLLWKGLVLAAALLSLAGLAYAVLRDRPDSAPPIQAIAVLPFLNETGDSDADYLADGTTESLINALSDVPGFSVKARSSVFPYQGSRAAPQRIASELGVQGLVYGRLVRDGDAITVYLSMVDGRSGNQLWGSEYRQTLATLPSMSRDIATDVARRLRVSTAAPGGSRLGEGYTPRSDAYLLYLRGRYHARRSTEADIRAAIGFFEQAIAADPSYALAHAGLANAWRALSIVGREPSMRAFPRARAAAIRALQLDSGLADAHVALGWIHFSFDWDWAAAERELQTAIELNPESADAHRAYAHLLSNFGRHEEALVEARRARELDSRSLIVNGLEGQFLMYAGRLDEAEAQFRRTLEIDPNYWVAFQGLGRVAILRERYGDALDALHRARALSHDATEAMTQLGYALGKSGGRDEALAILKELDAVAAREYVPAYSFAMILNGLGESEAALRRLEQSVDQHEVQATFLKIDTRWDHLRTHPRFVALLERLNLS